MNLDQWLKLNIPRIPQRILDGMTLEQAERFARSGTNSVNELLRRDLEVDVETWQTEFQARRVIVGGQLAEPFPGCAPWHASKLGGWVAISADGVKVKGVVRFNNYRWHRLTRREQKIAEELFALVTPAQEGAYVTVRNYGTSAAPPIGDRVYGAEDDISAWWLDPLSHENNVAQMVRDANGFATLYARTRGDDAAHLRALDAVLDNLRRYATLFDLEPPKGVLEPKLERRVLAKRALRKLQGVTEESL